MGVAVRSNSTASSSSTTSLSVNAPSGVTSGDTMVCFLHYDLGLFAYGWTAPSGWVRMDNGNWNFDAATNGVEAWYKLPGSSEPASYSFTNASGPGEAAATIVDFSGAGAAPTVGAWNSGASGNTATALGITAPDGADMLCASFGGHGASGITPQASMTSQGGIQSYGTVGREIAATELLSASGASGNRTASLSPNTQWGAVMVLVRPSGGTTARPPPPLVSAPQPPASSFD
jgi:hypothetical protein